MSTFAPPLSERVADAIRRGDLEDIAETSPHAACLMPLLNALGWTERVFDTLSNICSLSSFS